MVWETCAPRQVPSSLVCDGLLLSRPPTLQFLLSPPTNLCLVPPCRWVERRWDASLDQPCGGEVLLLWKWWTSEPLLSYTARVRSSETVPHVTMPAIPLTRTDAFLFSPGSCFSHRPWEWKPLLLSVGACSFVLQALLVFKIPHGFFSLTWDPCLVQE